MTTTTSLLEFALVAVLCFPLLYTRLSGERLDLLTPPFFFSVFMFFCYVYPLAGFVEGTDEYSTNWDTDPAMRPTSASIESALAIAVLAAVAFFVGYYAFRPKRPSLAPLGSDEPTLGANPNRLLFVGFLFTTLGLGLFSLGVHLIGGFSVLLSSLGDRLRVFAGLNYLMGALGLLLCVSMVWYGDTLLRGRRVSWSFVAFTAVALAANALEGSKSIIFVFIVAMALMYHLLRRPIPVVALLSGAAALFVILTAYALVAREYLAVGEFTTVDPRHLGQQDVTNALSREMQGNFIQLQVLTTLIDRMPEALQFQHGATFLSLFTMPIPRGFWPDKPLPSTGVIALAFWPSRWLDWGTTMPPGLIGEMYLNFAGPGVGVGMLIFGWVYAIAERALGRRPRNVAVVILYALLLALLPHYLRGESVAPTVLLLMWAIPTLIAQRYVFNETLEPLAVPALMPIGPQLSGR